ncbi:hypothetical protein PoMZ_02974 [Pyricularia oryzae]|uniref:Secreted protein n=1 Tax=Pyricularia oryzae TaxID=318829 RepID=A0A4V1C5Y8_PYROR|nr:hypothetical protein PoMZ_02974 [Pyricularia oryzae]
MRTGSAALHLLELALELLDGGVGVLEVLVETVALGNELLLPLPEALLLDLDLLGEALAQRLLLLLELGVVQLAGPGLAELAGLHLLCAVGLVVQLLGCVDEIEHWSSFSTSATPHEYWRPLTMRPSPVLTSFSEPITAKGMAAIRLRACWAAASSSSSTGGW